MENKTDKLAIRFLYIITQLNSGKQLTTKELAQRFEVTERIIQKDLNEKKATVRYIHHCSFTIHILILQALIVYEDIKNFAMLSGIKNLYPSLEDSFLSDVLNKNINSSCLIKGGSYEDISDKEEEFDLLRLAIVLKHQISLTYNNKKRIVNPYKLVNNNDIWYLVGDEDGKLKTYSFTKILHLLKTENEFKPNKEFLELINKNQANWFSQKSINVILEIDASVAEYFTRRELLPNQTILKNTTDKLVIQTTVSYDDEILKVVRYWIPHIKIVEPEYLQENLLDELDLYSKSML